MKIRVVSSREEIFTLNPNERVVHLAFRPSNKDIFALVETCPKIEVIQLPKSYRRTVSKSIEMFLEMQRIQLIEGDVWGHRKDINEYSEIKPEIFDRIQELKREGLSESDILNGLGRKTNLSRDLLKFLLKEKANK